MKKNRIIAMLLLAAVLFSGCQKAKPQEENAVNQSVQAEAAETETYFLPESFWKFAGRTPEEGIEHLHDLGKDYYTEAQASGNGVELMLTEEQKNRWLQRNDDYIKELTEEFTEENSKYRYEIDENYQKIMFYFDEKIPNVLHGKMIMGIASACGMNYLIKNKAEEWHVQLEVYNCHTGKLVASGEIPNEVISYGYEEWKASYEK